MVQRIRGARHKNVRETNEIKQAELQELRKENQKLKRENARLRKDLHKIEVNLSDKEDEVEEVESIGKKENVPMSNECPECRVAGLTVVQLGAKVLLVCKQCKYRKMKG